MSDTKQDSPSLGELGGVLSKTELIRRLTAADPNNRIFITPMLDPTIQIGEASIDVRLGTDFILFKKNKFSSLDPLSNHIGSIGEFQERLSIQMGNKIYLHPREFILGITLEYIKLPPDVSAYITSRSTWGRLGLIIATATAIHPNYAGIITLELINVGETPIPLYPGHRIAQLIFHRAEYHQPETSGSYSMSTYPSFTKILQEPEWKMLRRLREQ